MPNRREFLIATGQLALAAGASSSGLAAGKPAPTDAAKKVRLGVVGGGFGSRFYFHEHPNCRVTAVSDLRADRRKRLRDTYHCDNVYDSLESMLKKENNLDAVAIFTAALDHYKHTEMCMNKDLHVISAVPACFSLKEAAKLKELKEKKGLRYMMAETSYYRTGCIYARNLYKEGGFGELFYTECEYYHDRGSLEKLVSDKSTRFYNADGSRTWRWGFPPLHYPTHSLGFVVGVTRERITRVSCLGWGSSHPWLDENRYNNPFYNETGLMQTDRGHMVRCNVFYLIPGHGERAQWFGEKGALRMAVHGLHQDTWRERSQKLDKGVEAEPLAMPDYWNSDMLPEPMRHKSGHGGSHVFLSAEFINALVEDREPAIDVYESLAMTAPGIVAHQSALKNGEQMKVPQFDRST